MIIYKIYNSEKETLKSLFYFGILLTNAKSGDISHSFSSEPSDSAWFLNATFEFLFLVLVISIMRAFLTYLFL